MNDHDLLLASARRRIGLLATGAATAAGMAVLAGAAGWLQRDREVAALCGLVAGGSLLAATAATAALIVDRARCALADALDARAQATAVQAGSTLLGGSLDSAQLVTAAERGLRHAVGWFQAALVAPTAAATITVLTLLRPTGPGSNDAALALGLTTVVLAFPLLLIERRLHATDRRRFPEAPGLARILRLGVWILVAGGIATAARAYDAEFFVWVQWGLAALVAGIAVELALRALAAPFLPVAHAGEAAAVGDSLITALVLRRGEGGPLFGGLKERFGIDLANSWAVRWLRRTALPLLLVLGLIAWLLTGLTTLGTGERGVYERCGAPVAVLTPGLHAHLPWPFGQVRRVEAGQIHELILGGSDADSATRPAIAADDETPAAYDRLWDRAHPADGTWLLPGAGAVKGTAGYQLMSADVRVLYRVGLDDDAARANAYRVADPAALVRGQALRQIQRLFAMRTLGSVIGEDRDRMARELQTAIQDQLGGSGLEVTAVVIDAIHPPIGAVPAYHGVQAAEIQAGTDAARARGGAATTVADARREAADRTAVARAVAGEAVADATARTTRYSADRNAFTISPAASRLERWLATLRSSLPRADLTIVDHRLPTDPTIDLRKAGGGE